MLDGTRAVSMMTRPRRELAIAHGAQHPAQRLLGDADPELLPNALAKIHDAPPDHAMDSRDRPLSRIAFSAARCVSVKSEGWPGGLRSNKPAGPSALNFSTQSHTISTVTLPIAAD